MVKNPEVDKISFKKLVFEELNHLSVANRIGETRIKTMSQSISHPNERLAQWCWTAFILMFFMIQAIIWTVAISLTAGDESHAVVANYDEQALKWDELKQLRRESAQLGWTSETLIDRTDDISGQRGVTVRLVDETGGPVTQAVFNMRAFHRAMAAKPQQLTFTEIGPGVYGAKIKVERYGKWSIVGSASVGDQVFLMDDNYLVSEQKD